MVELDSDSKFVSIIHIMREPTNWVRSQWSREDLDGKTVEFRLPIQNGFAQGIGQFVVRKNPDGMLAVDVETDEQGRHWAERIQIRYHLQQTAVERISRHQDKSRAEFSLI